MNPKRTEKKGKSFCGCCSKTEEFDSNEVIFECFGKEFTEYEYVIENLAIRPAPKKLLDLVPVHSTNISKKSNKIPTLEKHGDQELAKPSFRTNEAKSMPDEQGDFKKTDSPILKLRDLQKTEDFVSLKILPDEAEPRMCGPCNPTNYNSCVNYSYDQKPCGSCRIEVFPEKCKPIDSDIISEIVSLRRNIRSKEYRTTKQTVHDGICLSTHVPWVSGGKEEPSLLIRELKDVGGSREDIGGQVVPQSGYSRKILADLCEASENSLRIKPKTVKLINSPIPVDIKDTIEGLKFKKPLPQFYTRTEKKLFHKPGVYFAEIPQGEAFGRNDNTLAATGQQSNSTLPIRLRGASEQPRLTPHMKTQCFSAQSGQQRLSNQLDQPRLLVTDQSVQQATDQALIGIELKQSEITIDDLSENTYNQGFPKVPVVDSTAQTDISEKCPCPKKARKNLKWKIIINKHSNCKC